MQGRAALRQGDAAGRLGCRGGCWNRGTPTYCNRGHSSSVFRTLRGVQFAGGWHGTVALALGSGEMILVLVREVHNLLRGCGDCRNTIGGVHAAAGRGEVAMAAGWRPSVMSSHSRSVATMHSSYTDAKRAGCSGAELAVVASSARCGVAAATLGGAHYNGEGNVVGLVRTAGKGTVVTEGGFRQGLDCGKGCRHRGIRRQGDGDALCGGELARTDRA